jgi:glycosyltransferase involved in cell wall biosynthesis
MMNYHNPIHVVLICLANDIFSPPGAGWIGGGQVGFYELGRYLISKGSRVTYLLRQTGKDQRKIEKLGPYCKILRVPNSRMHEETPKDLGDILDELIANSMEIFSKEVVKPTLVHSQYWIGGACGHQISKEFRLRHLHSFLSLGRMHSNDRNNMSERELFRDNWELQIYESAEWLIAQSAFVGESFFKLYLEISHQRLIVVPHGVDHDLFSPRPESAGDYLRRSAARFR